MFNVGIKKFGTQTTFTAVGDNRRKYEYWIQEWPDGWVAQAVSDTGSGGILPREDPDRRFPDRWGAIACALEALVEDGGTLVVED